MSEWTVSGPETITFDDHVRTLHVRTVSGAVNVVPTDGPARLEVSEVDGPPLRVTLDAGVLTVTYEELTWTDFSWKSVRGFVESWRRKHRAVVSVAVPPRTRVELGTVSADAVVTGLAGRVTVRGASGHTTLVGLAGEVEAQSVTGSIDAQSVSGELSVKTVSGEFTVVEGTAARLRADSVSGGMTVDIDTAGPSDVRLNTVSGEVAVRVPHPADTRVEAGSASGSVSSAFDELRMGGGRGWGTRKLSGTLGAGTGSLQVTSVSDSVALLRRPAAPDDGPAPPDLRKAAPATTPEPEPVLDTTPLDLDPEAPAATATPATPADKPEQPEQPEQPADAAPTGGDTGDDTPSAEPADPQGGTA